MWIDCFWHKPFIVLKTKRVSPNTGFTATAQPLITSPRRKAEFQIAPPSRPSVEPVRVLTITFYLWGAVSLCNNISAACELEERGPKTVMVLHFCQGAKHRPHLPEVCTISLVHGGEQSRDPSRGAKTLNYETVRKCWETLVVFRPHGFLTWSRRPNITEGRLIRQGSRGSLLLVLGCCW